MVIGAQRKKVSQTEIKSILHNLSRKLKVEKVPFKNIFLFGSYARGNAYIDSDIDIAVVVPKNTVKIKRKILDKVYFWGKGIHVKSEIHLLTDEEFANPYLTLPNEIKKYGKRFF